MPQPPDLEASEHQPLLAVLFLLGQRQVLQWALRVLQSVVYTDPVLSELSCTGYQQWVLEVLHAVESVPVLSCTEYLVLVESVQGRNGPAT